MYPNTFIVRFLVCSLNMGMKKSRVSYILIFCYFLFICFSWRDSSRLSVQANARNDDDDLTGSAFEGRDLVEKYMRLEYNNQQYASHSVIRLLRLLNFDKVTEMVQKSEVAHDREVPTLEIFMPIKKKYEDFNEIRNFLLKCVSEMNVRFTVYGKNSCTFCEKVKKFIVEKDLHEKVNYQLLEFLPDRDKIESYICIEGGRKQFPVMMSSVSRFVMYESDDIIQTLSEVYLGAIPQIGSEAYPRKYTIYHFNGDIESGNEMERLVGTDMRKDVNFFPLSDKIKAKECSAKIRKAQALTGDDYQTPILFKQDKDIPQAVGFNKIKQFLLGEEYQRIYKETGKIDFWSDFTLYYSPNCPPCTRLKKILDDADLLKRIKQVDGSRGENSEELKNAKVVVFPTLAVRGNKAFVGSQILDFFNYLDSITEKKFTNK